MDFSKMPHHAVRSIVQRVCGMLVQSGDFREVYYRFHDESPVIYVTMYAGVAEGVQMVIQVEQIEKLADRLPELTGFFAVKPEGVE